MSKKLESILEPYLKKISEQNEMIIDLLKIISDNGKQGAQVNVDDGETIITRMESLTKRERQVIELLVQGKMNKEMAYELQLSLSTIEAHRSSAMKKMRATNVAQLTKDYMTFQTLRKY